MSFSLNPAPNETGSRVHSISFSVIMPHKLNIRMKMKHLILMFL